jgi:prevent-host-death family protein
MQKWQIQKAQDQFSELVKRAETEGPQEIIIDGRSAAIVMSSTMFNQLSGNGLSLVEFMRRSPMYGLEAVDLTRDNSPIRTTSAQIHPN